MYGGSHRITTIGLLLAPRAGAGRTLLPALKRLKITSSAKAKRAEPVVLCTFHVRETEARCARRSFEPESQSDCRGETTSMGLIRKVSAISLSRSKAADASARPMRS